MESNAVKIQWSDFVDACNYYNYMRNKEDNIHNLEMAKQEDMAIARYEYIMSPLVYPGDVDAMVKKDEQKFDIHVNKLQDEFVDMKEKLATMYHPELIRLVSCHRNCHFRFEEIVLNYLKEDKDAEDTYTIDTIERVLDAVKEKEDDIINQYLQDGDACIEDIKLPDIVPELWEIAEKIRRSTFINMNEDITIDESDMEYEDIER